MTPLLTVSNLSRDFTKSLDMVAKLLNRLGQNYREEVVHAVDDVSFSVFKGEIVGVVGESGCGKSTLGRMVAGILPPTNGQVSFDVTQAKNTDIPDALRTQMIFQDPYASLNPRWRVREIINEPVSARGGTVVGLAEKLLEQVGLSSLDADKFPHEFSGGQRQRICIARALASEPKLIVCDEPTSALDVSVQAQVLNLMSDLQENLGLTYLFISHDLTVVQHISDKIGVLYLGRLVEEATPDELFENPKHPYTQMLLAAAPKMDGFGREIDPPQGEIPDPINPPTGCAFHPRCPIATAQCSAERPEMRVVRGARVACHLAE